MPHIFDVDTAMEPAGPGTFKGRMSRDWWIFHGPNGGYVAATILHGLALAVDDPARSPRSLTVHYTERPAEGPVTLETRIERSGHKLTTVSGRLTQEARTLAVAVAAFSADRKGLEFTTASMPAVAPPEQCPTRDLPDDVVPPMMRQLDTRWAVGPLPFTGETAAEARSGAWLRAAVPRTADAAFVALLTDAVTPAVFSRVGPGQGITEVPTVDLTIHFRNHVPESATPQDFYLASFTTRTSAGGFVEEDGEIWSRDGLLLAQSRQLALVR